MKIVNAVWTPTGNVYVIECCCGAQFRSPVDLWWHRCPSCQRKEWIETIRARGVSIKKER
jgi:hypothetical protein